MGSTFKSFNNKANIFFQNIEQNNPDRFYNDTSSELGYFSSYIYNSIDSLNVERYALKWRPIKSFDYIIEPFTRIKITKPEIKIFIHTESSEFDPKKQFFDEDDNIVEFKSHQKSSDGVFLSLNPDFNLKDGDKLYYGRKEVEWKYISSSRIENIENLTNSQNNLIKISGKPEDLGEYYRLEIKTKLKDNEHLFLNNQKIDYTVEKSRLLKENDILLEDKDGKLDYSVSYRRDHGITIRTEREIKGVLNDSGGFQYFYRIKDKKNKVDGKNPEEVWIEIYEPESAPGKIDPDGEQSSIIEIFMELAGSEGEIWESPDLKGGKNNDRDKKIRYIRSYPEESRIQVGRLPKSTIIYPPKATSQLQRQLNAVNLLRNYPSPEHRTLLDFFEKYENMNWKSPGSSFKNNNITWEYLTDLNREGTGQQREFVIKAMNSPDVAILEGPPGSGKTTAISELIYQLLKEKKRVLLCASTHVAIDNVIEKMVDHCESKGISLEDAGIVPLRVGMDKGVVSERVREYHIDEKVENFSGRNKGLLDVCNNLTYNGSETGFKKDYSPHMEEIVIQSSNLICGTTMGIPNYPHIYNRHKDYVKPEFDCLIIDEASKTTFQEFLVPAVHSKKYILVGDIRQLSPSVDELNVRVNLDGVIKEKAVETALKLYLDLVFVFQNESKNPKSPKTICVEDREVIEQVYKIFSEKFRETENKNKGRRFPFRIPETVIISNFIKAKKENRIHLISKHNFDSEYHRLLLSDLIFIDSDSYKNFYKNLPETHILLEFGSKKMPAIHDYKVCNMFCKMNDRGRSYSYRPQRSAEITDPFEIREYLKEEINSKDWAGKIAWRMKRVYELENAIGSGDENSSSYYEASMHALLPPDSEDHRKIWKEINKVKRVAFPSVLTSLQVGVSGYNRSDEDKTILSHGIPDKELSERYEKLKYQHRMHPEISWIPREIYYKNEALRDVESVKDKENGGEGGREWNYDCRGKFKSRFHWRHVRGNDDKNVNKDEIKAVLEEVDSFVDWVSSGKINNRNKTWEILIVSFYDAQRKAIMEELKKKGKGNEKKNTIFDIEGIRVFNYTVDKVQGREADFVILSTVRTRKIGFMDNPNRQNVAITRARYQMLVIGDRCFFGRKQNSKEFQMIAEKSGPKFDFKRCFSKGVTQK